MEWTKIPTNLINGEFDDKEILAIVKYQLVYALYEEEPNEKILSRFLTKKQKKLVKNFISKVKTNILRDIETIRARRSRDMRYYKKKSQIPTVESTVESTVGPTATDKIREDKNILSSKSTSSSSSSLLPPTPQAKRIGDRSQEASELIELLNKKSGFQYKKIQSNLKLIQARLKDYTYEELANMIEYKCEEWLQNKEMCKYLRPSTLFRPTNCENYIVQSKMKQEECTSKYKPDEFAIWMRKKYEELEDNARV